MPTLKLPLKKLVMTIIWEHEAHEEDATINTALTALSLSQKQLEALSVIEMVILQHFKTGVDILSQDYLTGLETVIAHTVLA